MGVEFPQTQFDVRKDHTPGENIGQNAAGIISINGHGVDGVAGHLLKLRATIKEQPFALIGRQTVEVVENNQKSIRLSGLVKRIADTATGTAIGNPADVEAFKASA